MDFALHGERTRRDHGKVTFRASLDDLPPGAMVALPRAPTSAALVHDGHLFTWSPSGYRPDPAPTGGLVDVLTPRSSVAVLAAGYRPVVHDSAEG
jgi:hypothetical protein